MNISFDYDNTLIKYVYVQDDDGKIIDAVYDLPHQENIDILWDFHERGDEIYIVTSRIEGLHFEDSLDRSPKPEELVRAMGLPIKEIVYTGGQSKLPFLLERDIKMHLDDCPKECNTIIEHGGISVVEVEAPPGINNFLRNKFEKLLELRNE